MKREPLSILDFLIGRPLATSEERAEQIGILKGIPIFGLDALSSAAYGPEAALTLLIPLGLSGIPHIVPISLSIIVLLVIVFFSYLQTIEAYPGGGGSYTVAHENLGMFPGLFAASALMIDYVLTAAVGISAGIGALTSVIPSWQSERLWLCLAALLMLTVINLRGVSESGGVFMLPTYLFLGCMFTAIAIGLAKTLAAGGHPLAVVAPPVAPAAASAAGLWILLKAFSSGCTAMTGVEAVSNGVRAFRDPRAKTAQRTLAVIIACLIVMLAGVAFLVERYKIVATDPDGDHYQSVLSMLFHAVAGQNWFYFVAMASVLLVLIFSANTAFADFPRVCRVIAEDKYLPISLANRGRRLVYSEGVIVLAIMTAGLLVLFGGVTDRLIPLYAVGAFLAFTLSQAGMFVHWRREGKRGRTRKMLTNGLGALATGGTAIVVIVSKFEEGAWIIAVALPAMLLVMYSVRQHYRKVSREIESDQPLDLRNNEPPLVVVPLQQWNRIAQRALCAAMAISSEIKAVFVLAEEQSDELLDIWHRYVVEPAKKANHAVPELVVLQSPYRFVVDPIVDYVVRLSEENPKRRVIALIPELVQHRWYNYFLHSQRATLLKTLLLLRGNDRISVLNVPWYFK